MFINTKISFNNLTVNVFIFLFKIIYQRAQKTKLESSCFYLRRYKSDKYL